MRRLAAWLLALPAFAIALFLLSQGGPPAAAQPASAEKVVGGPYVVNVGPRSATLMWVVETAQASFGAEPGKLDHTLPILRPEKLVLTGLKPGTPYYYQAFAGEAGKGSFRTPPAGAARFQFVVFGDTRTRHDVHRAVINAILKSADPDFVIHTGDLVANGDDTSLWPIFFDIEGALLRKTAFFPSLGNHERNTKYYYDYMDARPYYSFDWGQAHFAVIDSDIGNFAATQTERDAFWQEQTRWLESDLSAARHVAYRFIVAHHPPISAVKSRQGGNKQMTALEPMLEKYKLTAGFFGHDHNYQHYLKNGVHYFVTGGGGAPLYDVDVPPAGVTVKVARTENFVIVNIDGSRAHIEAKTPAGETLDTADLEGSATPSPQP
jgi:hypothetical protein